MTKGALGGAAAWIVAALLGLCVALPALADGGGSAGAEAAAQGEPGDEPGPVELKDLTFPFFFGFAAVVVWFAVGKVDDLRREARGE